MPLPISSAADRFRVAREPGPTQLAAEKKPGVAVVSPRWKVSVQNQLTLGLAAVVGVLLALVLVAYFGLTQIAESERTLLEENFENAYDLASLRSHLNAERLDVLMMLEAPEPARGQWLRDLEERARTEFQLLTRIEARFQNDPPTLVRIRELRAAWDDFVKVRETEVLPRVRAGRSEEARDILAGPQLTRHQSMRELARELEAAEVKEVRIMAQRVSSKVRSLMILFVTAGGVAALGAIALGVGLHRSVAVFVAERRRAELELQRTNRALRTLSSCGQALVRASDEAALLREVCETIVREGGYRLAWIGFAESDPEKTVRPVAQAGLANSYVANARISWGDNEHGRGPTGTAIRTGRPSVCRDMRTDPNFAPWREAAMQRGFAASLVLPLLAEDRAFGALSIYTSEAGVFDADEVHLLAELAEDLAYGIRARRMRDQHARAVEALRLASHYNRSLIEASLDPLVTIGADGKITDVNAATEAATGVVRTALVGTDFSDYFTEPERARAGYQQVFRDGLVRDYPLELRHCGGRVTSVLYNAAVYCDEGGAVIGVFAAARDITERQRAEAEVRRLNTELERRVAERTDELETANRELEAFSYSVSHDLRAPLRSIDGFSRIVIESSAAKLDGADCENLRRVRAASQRMGELIDDLLKLSRTARAEMRWEQLDLSALADTTLAELQRAEPTRHVEGVVAPGLRVTGDPSLVRIVVENLLGNAWKFTSRRADARIEFGAVARGDEQHFFVRDNGAGFDPDYADKLFGPFQRLHTQDEFPGHGIGLATVQRILRRHGGRVWAEGKVNAGATFYFTLPGKAKEP